VLASLLPGLRELRAPLAAGYLWLVAAWLAFAGLIPRPDQADGIFKDVYDVAIAAGAPATAAAASFAAYLIGVLSVQATATAMPMLRVLRRRRVIGDGLRPGVATPSAAGKRALREAVLDQLADRYLKDAELAKRLEETRAVCAEARPVTDPDTRRALLDVRFDVDWYARAFEQDLALMPLRLLGEEKEREIYGEFDRLRAEAEFRASVALPLAAVVGVVAWRVSPWWLLAIVVPVLLVVEARHNVSAAADVLAESIRARAPDSPALNQVRGAPLRGRSDWVERAAKLGYAGAMAHLAETYAKDGDTQQAEQWYQKAANAGDAAAMIWLAGHLHRRADPEAEEWYAKAAAAGEPAAMTIAALAADFAPAEVADLKAAYAEDLAAMMRVGQHFEARGQMAKAEEWYRKSGEAGHVPARVAMAAALRKRGMDAVADTWYPERSGTADSVDADHDTTEAAGLPGTGKDQTGGAP
jgi:TPR repeat protein